MSLFAWEGRTAIYGGVKIACQNYLDASCYLQALWQRFWQLDPVRHEIVCDPENVSISSFTAFFLSSICWFFLLELKSALSHPVVSLTAVNLTPEPQRSSSTQNCESFQRLLNHIDILISKADASPFQHHRMFLQIRQLDVLA